MRLSAIVAAVLVTLSSAGTRGQSLEESVVKTLQEHPEINRAFNQYKSRYFQHKEARSAYLPAVDLTAVAGWELTDNHGSSSPYSNGEDALDRTELGISLSQIIFDGFSSQANVARTDAEALAQKFHLMAVAEDTTLRVVEVYLNVLRHQQILALSQSNLGAHEQIYADIKKRTDAGLGSNADLVQITGRLARAESNLIAARNSERNARTQFLRVINAFPDALTDPVPDPAFIPVTEESAIEFSTLNHPSVKSAEAGIDAAKQQLRSAKSGYLPTFTVEADANWDNDIDGIPGHKTDYTAMLRMRYNLFSGGQDKARATSAAYQISESKDVRLQRLREQEEEARHAWSAKESLARQKGYIQAHVDASQDTVAIYKKQFNLGIRSLLDVLNTENELFEAKKSLVVARYDELFSDYRLLAVSGRLLESLKVTDTDQWEINE